MNVRAVDFGASSDVGVVRDHNEDSYLIKPPLFIVADGMGGHAAGEVASRLAVQSFSNSDLTDSSDPEAIRHAVAEANRLVFESATGSTQGMGTTCALLLVGDGIAHVANVGDSRVYLLRADELTQLSKDHTLAAEMVDQGLISAEQGLGNDGGSQITRALGGGDTVNSDTATVVLKLRDRFMLCSDGLSSMVADDDITKILLKSKAAQEAAENLVAAANEAGGDDNVTVIVVDVDLPTASAPRHWRRRTSYVLLLLAIVLAVIAVTFLIQKYN
jgi:protein phosphatase